MNRQAGLTLVEVMISLTLGLLLLAGIGAIYLGSSQTYRAQEANARIQETGRYALDVIGRSLRQAGYVTISTNSVDTKIAFVGTPITGTNGSGTAADTVTVQYDGLVNDRDCEGNVIAAAMVAQDAYQLDAVNFELECDGNVDGVVDPQPLVDGIEDMQIIYGIDTIPLPSGDQSADSYTATPGNWGQVVSARVCLLVRSANLGVATSQSYLNCPGALGTVTGTAAFTTATDTRLRRTFVATFNPRNRVNNLP